MLPKRAEKYFVYLKGWENISVSKSAVIYDWNVSFKQPKIKTLSCTFSVTCRGSLSSHYTISFLLTDSLVVFFLFFPHQTSKWEICIPLLFFTLLSHRPLYIFSDYKRIRRKCQYTRIWEFQVYKCVRYLLNNTGTCAFSGLCSHEKRSLTVKANLRFERKYLIHLANNSVGLVPVK